TPLQVACMEGKREIVELLLSPKYPARTDIKDVKGRTLLHLAIIREQDAVAEFLLSTQKTLVNEVDANSQTALHLAASNGASTVIDVLLKENADPNVTDYKGRTALQLAGR
ncbi:ankyrin protein, partial [Xylogone sp. PMI_703]